MGIYGQRFYFREGLPNVVTIEDKFREITGLDIELKVTIWLNQLMSERDEIITQLVKDKDQRKFIFSPAFTGDSIKAQRQLNGFGKAHFYCKDFDSIYLGDFYNENSFHIEYGIGNHMYIFLAFIKTIFEIGGLDYEYNYYHQGIHLEFEEYIRPYHPHEKKWKRIKKWAEMSAYEKASFTSKYAK